MIVEWFTPAPQPTLEWFGELTGTLATVESQGISAVASVVGPPADLLASGGFGYLFVSDNGADQIFNAAPLPLRNNGGGVINRLKAPFDTATLVDSSGVITPRAENDVYRIIVRVNVTPSTINTDMEMKLDIGGAFGVIETDRHRLGLGAGVSHQETFIFPPFTGSTFVANGGTFLCSADAEITVTSVDYRIFPESIL